MKIKGFKCPKCGDILLPDDTQLLIVEEDEVSTEVDLKERLDEILKDYTSDNKPKERIPIILALLGRIWNKIQI